jgi:hypothetical protein
MAMVNHDQFIAAEIATLRRSAEVLYLRAKSYHERLAAQTDEEFVATLMAGPAAMKIATLRLAHAIELMAKPAPANDAIEA